MPLVVPVLRFFVVFLNVYETFKTLKPPPPSARRGSQPSTRAISQRKRDLKGCLAVWVVWCCYAVYERTFDRVVGIFLPFYSEIKSVFLLFLVLTRAKGAEPLFLHILRPLVKPYAAVVDPVLELSRDIGDFFFAVLQVPLDYILSSPWFPSWCSRKLGEELSGESSGRISSADAGSPTRASNQPSSLIPADHASAVQASRVPNRYHVDIRSAPDNLRPNGRPYANNSADSNFSHDWYSSPVSLPACNEHPPHDPLRYSQTLPRHHGRQVWYPPASVSGSDEPISTLNLLGTPPEYHSPEWRTYPAFPSAYPPTPLPAPTTLPSTFTTRSCGDHRPISDSACPPIPEDGQGFWNTLESAHEGYPDFVPSSSDSNKILPGVNTDEESFDATRQPDEDTFLDDSVCSSETGLSEDDFGASLRTPHRPLKAMPSSAYSSADSLASAPTTTSNAYYLRTKTSSHSLSSGSSSLAGRKRTHGASQGKARNIPPTSHSRNGTLRGKPAPPALAQDLSQASANEDEVGSEVGDDSGNTMVKRQRLLDRLNHESATRPTARVLGNTRKGVMLARNPVIHGRAVTTTSQRTARKKAGSATTTPVDSTIQERKPALASRQVMRSRSQAVIKSSSTSSSQSGTLKGRAY